ncbi:hypothetical protein EDB85DRAFT_1965609 [Lactarius pseudohatsudake]|nr:hypothetical protein EDB85DRAFT_1965609 [Lactarius pseudohatsudake]
MKVTSTTLLPFAPHQQLVPSSHSSPQRASVYSRVPINSSILYSMPSSASPLHDFFDVPHRPNSLRFRPSIISEASYESSSSSSSSTSSSSFPNTSPTSCSTPPSSLPPSPPPTSSSFGKSRPLPKIPKSQPPPSIASPRHPLPSTVPPHRPRSPPPAWSPRQTTPVSGRSPPPASSPARPQRPKVILPLTLPQRPSSASPTPRLAPPPRLYTPPIDGSHAAPLRVRPLPVRPPPPGPPSEGDTPIAPFGKLRWTDALPIPEDDDPSLCDDRRAIDWDLIDEVMKHAS